MLCFKKNIQVNPNIIVTQNHIKSTLHTDEFVIHSSFSEPDNGINQTNVGQRVCGSNKGKIQNTKTFFITFLNGVLDLERIYFKQS